MVQLRLECTLNLLIILATVMSADFRENSSLKETQKKHTCNREKSYWTTTDCRTGCTRRVQVTEGNMDFHQCGAKLTHLGLKLQVRHSKPPLDQPTQTDSDAAATSLRMCPCSYMAQIQGCCFFSFLK